MSQRRRSLAALCRSRTEWFQQPADNPRLVGHRPTAPGAIAVMAGQPASLSGCVGGGANDKGTRDDHEPPASARDTPLAISGQPSRAKPVAHVERVAAVCRQPLRLSQAQARRCRRGPARRQRVRRYRPGGNRAVEFVRRHFLRISVFGYEQFPSQPFRFSLIVLLWGFVHQHATFYRRLSGLYD